MRPWLFFALLLLPVGACRTRSAEATPAQTYAVTHTDAEWRKLLTPAEYDVLRRKGTEPAFSSPLSAAHDKANYVCAACRQRLFSSDHKFDSGTGWPSFYQPIDPKAVETKEDASLGESRTEVRCARCGGHLGHVFDDGPKPTGLRYCINGVALRKVAP
jgi:peptide-methionine (R)-S-oxide reductase